MEWCNQITSIKYLFKYIDKGYDRITSSIIRDKNSNPTPPEDVDKIKQYLDCCYISSCETCWWIFSFFIRRRKPAVERMFFYLLGQQSIYLIDYECTNDVLIKLSVTESMFSSWVEANKKYP